ncbi:hypothetical protein CFOL_v3_24810 [Cephalotus follicularis]|uniref:CCHC-type domain-containing protein n=1 Tax=Cephalotus follicularis TaxID=3775 RepID=A0A1Q3CMN3_CEPFO|nr:hypothetical protein CFOL_v3_24810 [Cephalotus follicularis]
MVQEVCLRAYNYKIKSVTSSHFWPKKGMEAILAPPFRVMSGRPRRMRRKDPLEPKKVQTKPGSLSRRGRQMACTKCGSQGLNKRGCKNPPRVPESEGTRASGGREQGGVTGPSGEAHSIMI